MEKESKRIFDIITFFDAANLLKDEFNRSSNKQFFNKDLVFKNYFEVKNNAKLLFTLKQNEIVNDVEPDILINADKEAVQFVLRNLISNANKFTDNGSIRISFFTDNNKCFLKVKDTGIGLEMDKISQILQDTGMFHTSGTRNEKGNGLGLSLIKSYLTKTGNQIEIKSVLQQGTSVSFSLCSVEELIPIFA